MIFLSGIAIGQVIYKTATMTSDEFCFLLVNVFAFIDIRVVFDEVYALAAEKVALRRKEAMP